MDDYSFNSGDLANGILKVPARIVDFSIEDADGNLVMPSRSYDEFNGITSVDLNGWNVGSENWKVRKMDASRGYDAKTGITEDEYVVRLYLLKTDGRYIPYGGSRPSVEKKTDRLFPLLGNRFFASGTEQYVNEKIVRAVIPLNGDGRQYFGLREIAGDFVSYHYQIFKDSEFLMEKVQNSSDYAAGSQNHGNIYYVPNGENLRNGSEYYWRVRASYGKEDAFGSVVWSDWSETFPFRVNTPPEKPFNLMVG